MIAVVTDSCASIPPELVEELEIEVVPYYVHRGDETLRDGVDIMPGEFFEWLPTARHLPTTANPGPGDFLAAFERVADRASEIITVHMTSKGSGAYQSACVAREMAERRLPGVKIEVIDTLQVAMIHGYAAIEAARAARRGGTLEQAVAAAQHVSETGLMLQAADTLRYLYLGGRIGLAKHLVGTFLNVKPIVSMREGIVVPVGQGRNMQQVYGKMVDMAADRFDVQRPIKAAVTYAADVERALALLETIRQAFICEEVLISELSPALGVHTGPGLVGAQFIPVSS